MANTNSDDFLDIIAPAAFIGLTGMGIGLIVIYWDTLYEIWNLIFN